jgi:signal transduction histidine kinase
MMERKRMHVVRLVNDLLDVSRIQKGHLGLTRSKISVQSDGSSKGSTFRVMLPSSK